ncbi:Rab GTPase-binding effector protein 1 [Trichostrongylus colubriformis]|uniref:Rab GTPase-binding effector protein 1 n=1 Tax=Trichostrongylus colubriformis TaxID=6319 RepID=A0AAN8EZG5_TRICO
MKPGGIDKIWLEGGSDRESVLRCLLSILGGEMEEGSSNVKSDEVVTEDGVVQNGGSGSRSAQISPNSALTCEMCQNYEVNLTLIQENERKAREKLRAAKSLADRYEVELATERKYRVDVEKKMTELAAQFNDELKCAVSANAKIEDRVKNLVEKHKSGMDKCSEELENVHHVCSGFESDMKQIASKYQELLGTNRTTAAEMRAEPIDLPQSADQLQFLCLQMREELIELKSARQHEQNDMRDEIALLKEQLDEERNAKLALERDLLAQVNHLQTQLGIAASKLSTADAAVSSSESHSRQIRDLQSTVAELEAQVKQVQSERAAVELTAQNYKARCTSLQSELDTSEAVQKDFVQLSQSLQIQLEKIRQSEQEVRWQWEDDVENCSGCGASVLKVKPKPRCLHCCKIFCSTCVQHTVPSGPNRRPANVCQVCHTLLNRDSKPFFAVDPTN